MRLVQKSLLHTGYFITDTNEVIPSFTNDMVEEAMIHSKRKHIKKMYGALTGKELFFILQQIKEFKREHGIIPQNLVEMIRTGFSSASGLKQSHNLFIYK